MKCSFSLVEIAKHIDGEIRGDEQYTATRMSSLESSTSDSITFYLPSVNKRTDLSQYEAGALIMTKRDLELWSGNAIIVDDPYLAYAKAAELFQQKQYLVGIHKTASIGDNTDIASTTSVGINVVIGQHCQIGENTIIKSNVVICDNVKIGDNCIIHEGAIIGGDGFGNAKEEGKWYKIPQLGGVRIGNRVEVGANTTIDCGALDDTIIEDGVRLDNLIQIAHNVIIGENTAIAAQSGIAGSAVIGKNCMISGHVAVVGHTTLCDNVILTGKAMVSNSINEPGIYSSGTGLFDNSTWRRIVVRLRKLDELAKQVKKLTQTLKTKRD
jgi:UDP-3-O-[3-hydroxymyristoyl] glucosamine N-acyltransferase